MSKRVEISIDSHIANVMLNRAHKYNALDLRMFEALGDAADEVRRDRSVRAVVLYGAGDNFCGGIDVNLFSGPEVDFAAMLSAPVTPSAANVFQRAAYAWRELPMPVICALQGITFGGGLQIALGADIRYAAVDTQLSIMELKWGLIPDMSISTTLRNIVAPDRVKELAWSGRVVSAEEALQLGLLTAVSDDPLDAARRMAATCADRSPDAVRAIKSLVNKAWLLTDVEALVLEAELQSGIIGSENQLEAVAANLSKRPPEFND